MVVGYDKGFVFGLVTANRDGSGGIYIQGSSTSSTRNAVTLCYRASDDPAPADVACALVHTDLPSRTPLEIRITCLANPRRVGLRVRNRVTGELVCCHEIEDLPAFQSFPQRLVVSCRGGRNKGPVHVRATGFCFRFPKGGGFDLGVEDPAATAYHRANAALARGDTETARALYRRFLDAAPATANGDDSVLAALSLAILDWRLSPDEETRARILEVAEGAGRSLDELVAGRVFLLTEEERGHLRGR